MYYNLFLGELKIRFFVEETVSERHTLQDMLRWTVSRFHAAALLNDEVGKTMVHMMVKYPEIPLACIELERLNHDKKA